jgi:hypothetical protein
MRYRRGESKDMPAILAFLDRVDYFDAPPHEGGHWLVAEEDGNIVATIWFFYEPPYAFVDYWAGKGLAAMLVAQLAELILRHLGVKRVLGVVQLENARALNTSVKRLGANSDGHAYYLMHKDIDNGTAED